MADAALIFFSAIITAYSYAYFLSSNLPKGIYRLISLLPFFYLFTILPLLLSSAIVAAVATFLFTWLANSKLLLFAFDRGPLFPPKSLLHFIATASLPAKINNNNNHQFQSQNPNIKKNRKTLIKLWIESFVSPFLINFVYNHKHELNPKALLIVYCFLIFILIDLVVSASNAVLGFVLGLELEPAMDEPYLSTSIQDFWGRRWNLMVTNCLRHTVYKPVRSVFPPGANKDYATATAVVATFLVSGLMHELLFYYVTRVGPTWEMTWFFVFHGLCLVAEMKVKRAVAGKVEVPAVVGRVVTVGFMLLTSFWLFFPPLVKSGADVKVLEDFKLFFDYVKKLFTSWLHEKISA